jgi:glycine/D-amino acid oxidase-like deaminating enzyme
MQPELYWLDADPLEPEPHPTLVGDVTTDLCIVGAGYTGLWTALLAKERNPEREVIIVEQRETGFGASGRNGGFCNSSLTHGFINGYRRFKDDMQDLERMGRENFNEIEATIKKYGIDCDWQRTGELRVAVKDWQLDGMKEEADLRNQYGDHVEVLSQAEVQRFASNSESKFMKIVKLNGLSAPVMEFLFIQLMEVCTPTRLHLPRMSLNH